MFELWHAGAASDDQVESQLIQVLPASPLGRNLHKE